MLMNTKQVEYSYSRIQHKLMYSCHEYLFMRAHPHTGDPPPHDFTQQRSCLALRSPCAHRYDADGVPEMDDVDIAERYDVAEMRCC